MSGRTCAWMECVCGYGGRAGASGHKCWSPTGCGRTAAGSGSPSCATRERARRRGRAFNNLYTRGLTGKNLLLVVSDGCPGLAAALATLCPRVKHPRCWVHKMRNILEKVRKRDYEAVKKGAQAIYRAENRSKAAQAFGKFRDCWRGVYASMVKQLERDLAELLTFFDFPKPLGRKLRTTNVSERCFGEVRRRTRPMLCFVKVASVDRIIYAICKGLNENREGKNRTLRLFTQAA